MSSIKVNFEIGHAASMRSKKTPEGFTHDWEVFVRGQERADISHFVEKVVFHLHETFPRPRRVVKEPPFSIKESGYAGFMFPIEIYLKNKDEPKKIKFLYDFTLQQSGSLKDRYIFITPNDEFKKKLLKGGGIPVSSDTSYYTNPDQENRSRDSFNDDKQQLVSKPKLSAENMKKHKSKEHKEEVPQRASSFENLFGAPIQKPLKVSPDTKKLEKNVASAKSDKKDKDRSSTDKKSKHEHKESKPDKVKNKEEKDKNKSDKVKSHSKDQEKLKDKSSKRQNDRPPSPEPAKKRCLSPVRKPPSPPPRSSSASSFKEDYKLQKLSTESEGKKTKIDDKPNEPKPEKEVKEKKKKEKKSHDRDKERKERKESRKENQKIKESPASKEPAKEVHKESPKVRETPKETIKETPPVKDKPVRPEKSINKFSIENLRKTPPLENDDKQTHHKSKDKSESERKHKHKKKDKKRDESREKHKDSSKEKKHKHEKVRETPVEKPYVPELCETPIPKDRPIIELGSPISLDTASQCSSKSGLAKISHFNDDANSSHSDSESSLIAEEEIKPKIENPSPELVKTEPPEPEPEPEPEAEAEPEPPVEVPPPQAKEKSKKHKDKSLKKEEKRRKRKAAEEEDGDNKKANKTSEPAPPAASAASAAEPERGERGESSGSLPTETKLQDNGVSSSLGEDAEPGDLSPDYMLQLKDLRQRIMKIKSNEELERVVNLIAETGRYEVTNQTFDFDLCTLDRSTVQRLIQLVGC